MVEIENTRTQEVKRQSANNRKSKEEIKDRRKKEWAVNLINRATKHMEKSLRVKRGLTSEGNTFFYLYVNK